jgi:hypothetical protein
MERLTAIGVITLLLAACGGGGEAPAPRPDSDLGGLWIGTGTNDFRPGIVSNILGISTDDGRLRLVTDEGTQMVGTMSSSGTSLSGNVVAYASSGLVFSNGLPTTTGTLSGTIIERQSLEGEWTASTGQRGDFVLVYQDLHNIGSALATIAGTYTAFDSGVPDATITFAADGAITGSDDIGCIFSGFVKIIDATYNTYELDITVGNCGEFNGIYNGLGAYDPSDQSFTFQADNGTWIFTEEIFK